MPPHDPLYVVTGAAGFIGSNLVRRLLDDGARVRGVDDFSTGRPENLDGVRDRIDVLEGDLAAPGVADAALDGADCVLHQAAIPSVPRSVADPLATNRSCVDATLRVLLAARGGGVRRVVLAASSSAYGDSETLPKVETMPTNPLSPYAVAKLVQEQYAAAFGRCYDVDAVCLRYFNVFGPRQDPGSDYAAVIPKFIRLMLDGRRPVIYGDGAQSRDFTYVENVVQANLLAARAEGPFRGEAMNVACGERIDLNELVRRLNAVLGTDLAPAYAAPRAGDVKHSLADISRAADRIGYRPTVAFDEGLRRTVAWLRDGQA